MKTWLLIGLISVLVWTGGPAGAEESSPGGASGEEPNVIVQIGSKFGRGVANVVSGWLEVPKQIYRVGHEEGWIRGSTKGPFEGLGMFGARTIAGAYEILTFPLPIPPHYQPMLKPEYVWQPEPAGPASEPGGPPSKQTPAN